MQPFIGIPLDYENDGDAARYSRYPWYVLRENYCTSIAEKGGAPLLFPYVEEHIDKYLSCIQGLLITGGKFDVSPDFSGKKEVHPKVHLKPKRTQFELALLSKALERKMPILGICGGAQLLNVALGGTLIQHIPDTIPNALPHEQPNPRHETSHGIEILEGTYLRDIVRSATAHVNSAHHQAVETLGKGLRLNALAPDGVIEGFEMLDYPFGVGVQWHPEFFITSCDHKVFEAFIAAAKAFCPH
ncbi:MAG: gamma-glutamyl-gamma-aminobutyrate hydrolase family protein [Alphaproteobacteria bacterium]